MLINIALFEGIEVGFERFWNGNLLCDTLIFSLNILVYKWFRCLIWLVQIRSKLAKLRIPQKTNVVTGYCTTIRISRNKLFLSNFIRRLFKLCTVLNLLWNPVGNQYILFKRMSLYSFQQLELKLIQVKISWHFQTCQSNGSLCEYYLHKRQRTPWDQSIFRNGAKITVIPLILTKHQFRIETASKPLFQVPSLKYFYKMLPWLTLL